ncbi:MAG: YvcK family protein [Chloroflexi bacterium]|nr:YvcK family protein [Chloroflexota bacterium]
MDKRKVVVIGGGTGTSTALRGLKRESCQVTAVVTMADSGGSSGRLRDELDQLPPGDVRQCLVALAADDRATALLAKLLEYRFPRGNGLSGHSFGNLFLAALTEITGDIGSAIAEASRILRVQGTVLPVTLTKTTLKARLADGTEIAGEAAIGERHENLELPIDYVYLDPRAYPYPPVLEAIDEADAIVIGPGDIYTSIIPNLLVEGVAEAILKSQAIKVYVCNLMTKPSESHGFKASSFLRMVCQYLGTHQPLDYMVVNAAPVPAQMLERYCRSGQHPVVVDVEQCRDLAAHILAEPLLSAGVYLRHDSEVLGRVIMQIVEQEHSPFLHAGVSRVAGFGQAFPTT